MKCFQDRTVTLWEENRTPNFEDESPNLTQLQSDKLHEATDLIKMAISDIMDNNPPSARDLHIAVQHIVTAARNGG